MRFSSVITSCISLALVMFACAAPSPDGTKLARDEDQTASKEKTPKSSSGGATPDGSDAEPEAEPGNGGGGGTSSGGQGGDASCGVFETSDGCWACCEMKFPEVQAAAKKIAKNWQTCACQPSLCGTVCANDYCAKADPDDDPEDPACEACVWSKTTDPCHDIEDDEWDKLEADPIYAPVDACARASQCDLKPDED